jgi:hypothetical protein
MRSLATAIIIGSLTLIGALPATAQSAPALGSDAPVRPAATGDMTADRDTYTRKAQDDMQDWQRKLHDFGEKAAANGHAVADAAENDLNAAWIAADADARKLQIATAAGWEDAKISFEKASRDLADAWDKIRLQDK